VPPISASLTLSTWTAGPSAGCGSRARSAPPRRSPARPAPASGLSQPTHRGRTHRRPGEVCEQVRHLAKRHERAEADEPRDEPEREVTARQQCERVIQGKTRHRRPDSAGRVASAGSLRRSGSARSGVGPRWPATPSRSPGRSVAPASPVPSIHRPRC
jgi:hypothetical protein